MADHRRVFTKLALLVASNVALALVVARTALLLGVPRDGALLVALITGVLTASISAAWFWMPLHRVLRGVNDGIRSFKDGDFSLRLVPARGDEVGDLVELYNGLADVLRKNKSEIYERELLLDTLLQRAPMAIVLMSPKRRVLYANAAAKRFFGGAFLPGRELDDVLQQLAPELREMLAKGDDGVVTVADKEIYRVLQRGVELGTVRNGLLVIERVTFEHRRQEIETWKKVIRVLSHELNNSLAPMSSLIHSARHVANVPAHQHKQDEILAAVDERVQHLVRFLDGYAKLARLPRPRQQAIELSRFIEPIRQLFTFRVEGVLEGVVGFFDPTHMEQVLINLLKNAHESGSAAEQVVVSVLELPSGELSIAVADRGAGMSEEMFGNALLPLAGSSTKAGGSGVGLALCNEVITAHGGRISIASRIGEGTTVTCVLPPEGRAPGFASG